MPFCRLHCDLYAIPKVDTCCIKCSLLIKLAIAVVTLSEYGSTSNSSDVSDTCQFTWCIIIRHKCTNDHWPYHNMQLKKTEHMLAY